VTLGTLSESVCGLVATLTDVVRLIVGLLARTISK